jgi:hypothetical protein
VIVREIVFSMIAACATIYCLASPTPQLGRSTARIYGRVVAALPAQGAIRGAVVVATELESGRSWQTASDADGFRFDEIPEGRYTIGALKTGFLDTVVGVEDGLAQPRVFVVHAGRTVDVSVAMIKAASLQGCVYDRGRPGASMAVRSARVSPGGGRRESEFLEVRTVRSDADGCFQVPGLRAGEYLLGVSPEASVAGRIADPEDIALVSFYPSTSDLDASQLIRLDAGEERTGVDIGLVRARGAALSGSVSAGGYGGPFAVQIEALTGALHSGDITRRTVTSDETGAFHVEALPPGAYKVSAHDSRVPPMYAESVTLVASPTTEILMTAAPASTVAGWIEYGGGRGRYPTSMVFLERTELSDRLSRRTWDANIDPAGHFMIVDMPPGEYRWGLGTRGVSPAQTIETVACGGAVLPGRILKVSPGQRVQDCEIAIEDASGEISGVLVDSTGAPVVDYLVLALPVEVEDWLASLHRTGPTRPDSEGRYRISKLSKGPHLLLALISFSESMLRDPAFMAAALTAGVRVDVRLGLPITQDLRIK